MTNGVGGGIANYAGTATLTNVTLSGDPNRPGTCCIYNAGGTVKLQNSALLRSGCSGWSASSLGGNVSGDATCFTTSGTDLANTDPMLGSLADNGGPAVGAPGDTSVLQTMALCTDVGKPVSSCSGRSPAMDHVPTATCTTALAAAGISPPTDERGVTRNADGLGCDAGAYESSLTGGPPPVAEEKYCTNTVVPGTTTLGTTGPATSFTLQLGAGSPSTCEVVPQWWTGPLTTVTDCAANCQDGEVYLQLVGSSQPAAIVCGPTNGPGIGTGPAVSTNTGACQVLSAGTQLHVPCGANPSGTTPSSTCTGVFFTIQSAAGALPGSVATLQVSFVASPGNGGVNGGVVLGTNTFTFQGAGTRYVATTGTDTGTCTNQSAPCKTIGYALSVAVAGDTIDVAAGTYNEHNLTIGTSVTITGAGAGATIVDGQTLDRVFVVNTGVNATLNNLTIQHGKSGNGGGGILNNGTLTLSSVTLSSNSAAQGGGALTSNSAAQGGGVFNGGPAALTDVTLSDNSATGSGGGGIYNNGPAALTLTNVTLSNNLASGAGAQITTGGAIYSSGTAKLTNVTASGNTASSGGGIYSDASLTITGATLKENTASAGGGGIYQHSGALAVTNSTVSGNSAPFGGGINVDTNATLDLSGSKVTNNTATTSGGGGLNSNSTSAATTMTVTGSTISGNRAAFGAGIDDDPGGALILTDSTVSANTATSLDGGGIHFFSTCGAPSTLTNDTISGNTAAGGGGIYHNVTCPLAVAYSTIAGNSTGISNLAGTLDLTGSIVANSTRGANCTGSLTDQGYNLSSDSSCHFTQATSISGKDPKLGPLALNTSNPTNTGTTQTQALQAGSPAIDHGATSVGSGACPATDQRGVTRPDAAGTPCDIGAFETYTGS